MINCLKVYLKLDTAKPAFIAILGDLGIILFQIVV
jgi:hypothetical protein